MYAFHFGNDYYEFSFIAGTIIINLIFLILSINLLDV